MNRMTRDTEMLLFFCMYSEEKNSDNENVEHCKKKKKGPNSESFQITDQILTERLRTHTVSLFSSCQKHKGRSSLHDLFTLQRI